MNSGLPEATLARIRETLTKFPAVDKAVLYGSRAMGTYREGSDIDLTLYGDALTLAQLVAIETAIDELLLPYQVDLSLQSQLSNADLISHIHRVGKIIYARDVHRADS
jgi:predicted nucleotidyltransferase